MRPVQLVLTMAFAIAVISVISWFGKSQKTQAVVEPPQQPTLIPGEETSADPGAPPSKKPTESLAELNAPLPLPPKGPYGKAVAVETAFDFGTLERGDTGSHTFKITNEGTGPLRLKHGATTCGQCTIGKVSPEFEDIPPGGTGMVQIDWKISAPVSRFRQSADIHTTDPDNRKLVFTIQGKVDTPIHMEPSDVWLVGELAENAPTTVEGFMYSILLDEVILDKAECSNPLVSVTWEPAPKEKLAEKSAKAGLILKATIAPGSPVGSFKETVKLHSPQRDGISLEFTLNGKRSGPIEIKGNGFYPDNNLVKLGEFDATKGAKSRLQVYVRNFEGDFVAEQIHPEASRAKVQFSTAGRAFGKSKIYDLIVEVPPGAPGTRIEKNAEPIMIKMNHPDAGELKMFVEYFAR